MERKIDYHFKNLETVVYYMLDAEERKEHVCCQVMGHELHSYNVTMDSAYMEVYGCTKEEYEQERRRRFFERKAREAREEGYAARVRASRANAREPITLEKVISGLKFIVEHQSMSQEELIDGLLELGCNFLLEDIYQQFPERVKQFEGMKQGNLGCGAMVIVNVRDREIGKSYCKETFLSLDDDTSVYHFIRITTGDKSYTKEMVDALNNANEKHR